MDAAQLIFLILFGSLVGYILYKIFTDKTEALPSTPRGGGSTDEEPGDNPGENPRFDPEEELPK